jgi:transposase
MRPVALGRRNWIHIGSEEAGPRVAAIVSIVETCQQLKMPIRDYLCSILPGLANFPINRIAELTPTLGLQEIYRRDLDKIWRGHLPWIAR